MSTFVKIIKINVFSLLTFPLFLLCTFLMMLLKALEKSKLIFSAVLSMFSLLILNLIVVHFSDFLVSLGYFILIFFFFGGIITFFVFIILLLLGITENIFETIEEILENAFVVLYRAVEKLMKTCDLNYGELVMKSNKLATIACVFYHIFIFIKWFLSKLFSYSFILSIIASISIFIFYSLMIHNSISNDFGIGVLEYLGLFPLHTVIFSIIYTGIYIFSIITVIISLGIEWSEWGGLMYSQNRERNYNIDRYKNSRDQISKLFEKFKFHLDGLENIQQKVGLALDKNPSPELKEVYQEYITILSDLSTYVSLEEQERMDISILSQWGYIQLKLEEADEQIKIINEIIDEILSGQEYDYNQENKTENHNDTKIEIGFFDNCATLQELKERYRSLSKIYHPDVNGDQNMFVIIQNQYEKRLSELS